MEASYVPAVSGRRARAPAVLCACAILTAPPPAAAEIIAFALSEGIPPPKGIGTYEMIAFPPDPRPLWEFVTFVPGPTGDVHFSIPLQHRKVGSGWSTWKTGYTGDVYYTYGQHEVALYLPDDTAAFILYVGPNSWATITVTASDGQAISKTGDFGFTFGFAFYTTDGAPLDYLIVSSVGWDFAIGQFLVGIPHEPTTLRVPSQFPTIQSALDAALPWDDIVVAPGVYKEYVSIRYSINLRSEAGPAETTIDAAGLKHTVVILYSYTDDPSFDARLEGFTITGGDSGFGGGIRILGCEPTIQNCVITKNTATYAGGGLHVNSWPSGKATLRNCVFAGNIALGQYSGEGGSAIRASKVLLDNCLLAGNAAKGAANGGAIRGGGTLVNCTVAGNYAAGEGGGLYGNYNVTSSILWGNRDGPSTSIEAAQLKGGNTTYVSYCCVEGWTGGIPGVGSFRDDPLFFRQPNDGGDGWGDDPLTPNIDESANDDFGDLHVAAESPTLDAGDPTVGFQPGAIDLEGRMRVWDADANGTARIDMGVYEFGSFVFGDLNCDGQFSTLDIEAFVLALTDPAAYALANPECDYRLADLNYDGAVDAFDIDPFVALLTGG